MEALSADIAAMLEPVRGGSFIAFHDAYQYFETDFAFPASGAISLSDATDPSPARIAEIQARIAEEGIDCVLAEPQFNPGIVAAVSIAFWPSPSSTPVSWRRFSTERRRRPA